MNDLIFQCIFQLLYIKKGHHSSEATGAAIQLLQRLGFNPYLCATFVEFAPSSYDHVGTYQMYQFDHISQGCVSW